MRIRRNLLIATASTIAAVGAIAGTSVLTASAAPRAAATEHLQIVNVGNSPDDAILYGPITGHAIDVENRSHTMSVLKFSNGTITISHPTKGGSQHFDPKTCLTVVSLHGTFKFTKGTGAYKGVTGSGTYQTNVLVLAARVKGKCSQTATPVAVHTVINAVGTAHK
jgi:hypothetical protein